MATLNLLEWNVLILYQREDKIFIREIRSLKLLKNRQIFVSSIFLEYRGNH